MIKGAGGSQYFRGAGQEGGGDSKQDDMKTSIDMFQYYLVILKKTKYLCLFVASAAKYHLKSSISRIVYYEFFLFDHHGRGAIEVRVVLFQPVLFCNIVLGSRIRSSSTSVSDFKFRICSMSMCHCVILI